ncbi:hypothetical protein [Streptomyces sp. NPDC058066]|uniref:hypothetical protein n=1 Tax=Streptomyces sp. NPDC058066 TaxID=3346323 RepID=UPI0036EFBBC8
MQYKMTEEFAGAMVTVIPVILLVAAVEFITTIRQVEQWLDAAVEDPAAPPRSPHITNVLLSLVWCGIAVAHIAAEVDLIKWLASVKRPADPGMARFVTEVAVIGFWSIVATAVFLAAIMFLRLWRAEKTLIQRAREAEIAEASTEPAPAE